MAASTTFNLLVKDRSIATLTLQTTLLANRKDSLLSTLSEEGASVIDVEMPTPSSLTEHMLPCIQRLYESPDAKITLAPDLVDLCDLCDVLDFLGLLPEGDVANCVDLSEVRVPSIRLRAKQYLKLLETVQWSVGKIEDEVEKTPIFPRQVLFVHDSHDQYDIRHHTDEVYFILAHNNSYALANNTDFREKLGTAIELKLGLLSSWSKKHCIVKVPENARDDDIARSAHLTILQLELPEGPRAKRKKTQV